MMSYNGRIGFSILQKGAWGVYRYRFDSVGVEESRRAISFLDFCSTYRSSRES